MNNAGRIENVFVKVRVRYKIAVLEIVRHVAILAVHHRRRICRQSRLRHFSTKLKELTQKRARGIVGLSVVGSIPFIRPPARYAKHWIGSTGSEIADLGPAAKIALPFVERSLVPICQPPLKSALRAKRRRRDFDFFVELEIFRFNDELAVAVLTLFRLAIHIFFVPLRGILEKLHRLRSDFSGQF